MPMTVEELVTEARRLPAAQVSELLDRLVAELPGGIAPEIETAWVDEAARRIEEIDSGKIQGVPADAVFARARKILGR